MRASEKLEDLGISKLDAFVMSAGTGGSIAGISKRLKEYYQNRNDGINLALVKDVDVDFIATKTKPEKEEIFAFLYGEDRSLNNKRKHGKVIFEGWHSVPVNDLNSLVGPGLHA